MNQLVILLMICGVVISGCSEAVDDTYDVPTLHLVLDSERSSESSHSSCVGMERYVTIDCHVQSDRPVYHDIYVLVYVKEGEVRKVGEVEDSLCTKWGRCERLRFVTILAGETQSKKLSLSEREWDFRSKAVPKVVVTLPPAHERATLLPRKISYTDSTGQKVEKDLLVEYPFNPYNVESPTEIRIEWRENENIGGTHERDELSEIHELLTRWETWYETEDVDAYISLFDVNFIYVSDMGTPNNPKDDVTLRYGDERESALRVFSLFQDIEIELEQPLDVELNAERNTAEVRVHYRIKGFVADGVSIKDGHAGWYAEGEFLFVLQKDGWSECEWRITRWRDKAVNKGGEGGLLNVRFDDVKRQ